MLPTSDEQIQFVAEIQRLEPRIGWHVGRMGKRNAAKGLTWLRAEEMALMKAGWRQLLNF